MGFFRRDKGGAPTGNDGDLAITLAQGEDMIERVGRAHRERWGLGTAERWDIDQRAGVIRWSFPDKTVEAPVQLLGSYHAGAGS